MMPVDYCETKRRKKTATPNATTNEQPIQIKLERIDRMHRTIAVLNEKLGVELISDDDEDNADSNAESGDVAIGKLAKTKMFELACIDNINTKWFSVHYRNR